jgi:tRNA A-37 threonylcarbamoyl transferase component Bud32
MRGRGSAREKARARALIRRTTSRKCACNLGERFRLAEAEAPVTEIPANDRVNEAQSCPRCGAGLSAQEAVQGLCAGCLLVAALDSRAEGESAPRKPSPSIESLAPQFPDLELLELVGQGGMGAVYRVRQKKLARFAALKILALDGDATPAFAERFEREARTLASLGHENIVAIYDQGRAGPHWYLLMEYVEGVSLRQMIRAREVDPRTALGLVAQICDALQCAHDRGVVHRDVKPENVLVDRRGRVKILDFGLAKLLGQEPRTGTLTETGQIMGTPRYMAPEQWERPLSVDHRADIYAVGVVFYELLTGELPIGAFQLPSHFASSLGAIDARVDPVVMKTLAKEPERRYQHASEVSTDVQRIASGPAAPAPSVAKTTSAGMPAWFAIPAIGCLVVLVVVFVFTLFFGTRLRDASEKAAATGLGYLDGSGAQSVLDGAGPGEQAVPLVRDPATGEFVAAPQAAAGDASDVASLADRNALPPAADAALSPEQRLAQERRIDALPGPPLAPVPAPDAPAEQVRRAEAKLDALWRVYLTFELPRTRVEVLSPTLVNLRVWPLDDSEIARLAAFADALYEPSEFELGDGPRPRYRIATSVATVDRLSPTQTSVSFASGRTETMARSTALAKLSEFLNLPAGASHRWFPALDRGVAMILELGPPVSARVVRLAPTGSSAPATLSGKISESDLEAAGYRRFVDRARESAAQPAPRWDLPAARALNSDELRAAERNDDERGGPSPSPEDLAGWQGARFDERFAVVDAVWRILIFHESYSTSTPQRDQVIVHVAPFSTDDKFVILACIESLDAKASVELDPGWRRRYDIRCPVVSVRRASNMSRFVGANVELHISPAEARASFSALESAGSDTRGALFHQLIAGRGLLNELYELYTDLRDPQWSRDAAREYAFVFGGDGSVRTTLTEHDQTRSLTADEMSSWRHRRFVEHAREVWNEKQKR